MSSERLPLLMGVLLCAAGEVEFADFACSGETLLFWDPK